jgi:hypothetical protein
LRAGLGLDRAKKARLFWPKKFLHAYPNRWAGPIFWGLGLGSRTFYNVINKINILDQLSYSFPKHRDLCPGHVHRGCRLSPWAGPFLLRCTNEDHDQIGCELPPRIISCGIYLRKKSTLPFSIFTKICFFFLNSKTGYISLTGYKLFSNAVLSFIFYVFQLNIWKIIVNHRKIIK